MKYHKITYPDINNGEGFRVTLWVAGCSHHCKGCHNPETWDFETGFLFTASTKEKLFDILKLPYIKGITFSGGEPLDTFYEVLDLVKEIKKEFPTKDIWLYSGYTIEEIKNSFRSEILEYINVLVDGKFILEQKDLSLPFRGSKNQNIIKL